MALDFEDRTRRKVAAFDSRVTFWSWQWPMGRLCLTNRVIDQDRFLSECCVEEARNPRRWSKCRAEERSDEGESRTRQRLGSLSTGRDEQDRLFRCHSVLNVLEENEREVSFKCTLLNTELYYLVIVCHLNEHVHERYYYSDRSDLERKANRFDRQIGSYLEWLTVEIAFALAFIVHWSTYMMATATDYKQGHQAGTNDE